MASRRILVVDDEPRVLTAWGRALRLAGYSVVMAQTAEQALTACNEHLFDLVILDFLMPQMDGIELLSRIRKRNRLVRAIIISGKLDSTVTEQEIGGMLQEKVEADRYLHKPISNDRLKATVEELFAPGETELDWQSVASKVVRGKATVQGGKKASQELKKYVKKRRRR